MSFKVFNVNGQLHMLMSTGAIKIVTVSELRKFLYNYNEDTDDNSDEKIIEDYEGDILVSGDGKQIIIHDHAFLQSLIFPDEFPYFTPKEFGEKFGREENNIGKLCRKGKILGAVQRGVYWFIPKEASYPEDGRRGRDMSKRYANKKED